MNNKTPEEILALAFPGVKINPRRASANINDTNCVYPDWERGYITGPHHYDKDGYCNICGHFKQPPLDTSGENWREVRDARAEYEEQKEEREQ